MNLATIIILISLCSQYSQGLATRVIENRQLGRTWVSLPVPLPKTDGYIAVQNCNEMGDIWYIKNPLLGRWESFLVIDCAMKGDGTIEWMDENDIAMEVDYETAVRWDTVGRGIWVNWTRQNPQNWYTEARNER